MIEWNPDIIIVAQMGQPGDAATQLSQRIGWADISAVKNRKNYRRHPSRFALSPGPRLIDGVKAMAVRLHKLEGKQ